MVKVHISGDTTYCLMCNGLQVPVSCSKQKEVKAVFGLARRVPANSLRLVRVK